MPAGLAAHSTAALSRFIALEILVTCALLSATLFPQTPSFNSTRAIQYVREIVAFGPRPIGSANHRKVENYIPSHGKGDVIEDHAFTATTPEGKFPVRTIIAK